MRDIDEMAGHTTKVSANEKDMKNNHNTTNSGKPLYSEDVKKVIFADIPQSDDGVAYETVPLPKIIVRDPVTHDTWEHGKYSTFQICLRTEHPAFHLHISTVRRRFSELIWLDNLLKSKNQGAKLLPPPPSKRIFSDRFSPGFLKRRAKEMQKYLNKLLEVDQVLSDNAFHLFVQTDLTTSELTDYFNGKLPEKIIAEAWANMGQVHSNSLLSKPLQEEPQEIVMNEGDLLSSSDDSACAAPTHSNVPPNNNNNNNRNNNNVQNNNKKNATDFDQANVDTVSSSNSSSSMANMTDLGRLGLPARAEVEMGPTLVVGEPAWQSESEGSGSNSP